MLSSDFPGLGISVASMTSTASVASMTSTASFHKIDYWILCFHQPWHQMSRLLVGLSLPSLDSSRSSRSSPISSLIFSKSEIISKRMKITLKLCFTSIFSFLYLGATFILRNLRNRQVLRFKKYFDSQFFVKLQNKMINVNPLKIAVYKEEQSRGTVDWPIMLCNR